MSMKKVLKYLKDNPGWHEGLEVVQSGACSAAFVYIYLSELEDDGCVESQYSVDTQGVGIRRMQYRATGKLPRQRGKFEWLKNLFQKTHKTPSELQFERSMESMRVS